MKPNAIAVDWSEDEELSREHVSVAVLNRLRAFLDMRHAEEMRHAGPLRRYAIGPQVDVFIQRFDYRPETRPVLERYFRMALAWESERFELVDTQTFRIIP